MDHSRWRYHCKNEEAVANNLHLFPRLCEKMREDPVRLIVTESAPKQRSSFESNMALVPAAREKQQSTSLFVERRRYAR